MIWHFRLDVVDIILLLVHVVHVRIFNILSTAHAWFYSGLARYYIHASSCACMCGCVVSTHITIASENQNMAFLCTQIGTHP